MPANGKAAVLVFLAVSNHPGTYRRQIRVELDSTGRSKSFRFSVIFTDVSLTRKFVGLKDFRQVGGRNRMTRHSSVVKVFPGLVTGKESHLSVNEEPSSMSVRTTSVNSGGETGLIKYFAAPALRALLFHSPNVMAVSTTMGMSDVAGFCLSIRVASTAFMSGRCKSVIMRFGRSVKALLIPLLNFQPVKFHTQHHLGKKPEAATSRNCPPLSVFSVPLTDRLIEQSPGQDSLAENLGLPR